MQFKHKMNDSFVCTQKPLPPFVRIVEQPARSAVRFRYECEGRSAGPIPGVNSSATCATYPTIQIMNYSGSRAMVVVSCVTVAQPYRQHPHHLVGRVGCHNGVCTMIVDNSDHLCTFTHLGIQCAKRNEISQRLKLRKQLQIDPTFGGFEHISKSSRGIDLGSVRLCFQVYLEGPELDRFCLPIAPVVSDPVYDKKLLSKLTITDISTTSTLCTGGKVMIFCNFIDEDDIEVIFFECDSTGIPVWQSFANLSPPFGEVHKRVGMSFMAPPYKNTAITEVVKCYMQLRRVSDHEASDPIHFNYLPINPEHNCPFIAHFNSSIDYNISTKCTKRLKNNCNNNNIIRNNVVLNQSIENNSNTNEMSREFVPKVNTIQKFEDIDSDDIEVNSSDNNSNTGDLNEAIIKSEIIENSRCNENVVNHSLSEWIAGQEKVNCPYSGTVGDSDEDSKHFFNQYI